MAVSSEPSRRSSTAEQKQYISRPRSGCSVRPRACPLPPHCHRAGRRRMRRLQPTSDEPVLMVASATLDRRSWISFPCECRSLAGRPTAKDHLRLACFGMDRRRAFRHRHLMTTLRQVRRPRPSSLCPLSELREEFSPVKSTIGHKHAHLVTAVLIASLTMRKPGGIDQALNPILTKRSIRPGSSTFHPRSCSLAASAWPQTGPPRSTTFTVT